MYSGVGISNGIAKAEVKFCKDLSCVYEKHYITKVQQEQEYVRKAYKNVQKNLTTLYELAIKKVGVAVAMIVQGHLHMVEDQGCIDKVLNMIEEQKIQAEWALQYVFNDYVKLFNQFGDSYQKARKIDLMEILNLLEQEVQKEKGVDKGIVYEKSTFSPFIALGRQFSIEDVLHLYERGAIGIVDLLGEVESHISVVVKTLGIPMIIKMNEESISLVGKQCIMDGAQGTVNAE